MLGRSWARTAAEVSFDTAIVIKVTVYANSTIAKGRRVDSSTNENVSPFVQ